MTHDELAHDLAECKRATGYIVAERLGLGSWGGSEQLDVATIRPSWSNPIPTAYEVKVSRGDYWSDLRSRKFARYQPFVSRLFYAVPAGMVKVEEVPRGIGLIVRTQNGWNVRRAAALMVPEADRLETFLKAMLFKDHPAPWKAPGRAERIRLAAKGSIPDLRRKGMERVHAALLAESDLATTRKELRQHQIALREAMPDFRPWGSSLGEYVAEAARRLTEIHVGR